MSDLRIAMTPTAELVLVGDSMCRVWQGVTAKGLPVRVLVASIVTREGADDSEIAEALTRIPNPLAPGQVLS